MGRQQYLCLHARRIPAQKLRLSRRFNIRRQQHAMAAHPDAQHTGQIVAGQTGPIPGARMQ